MNNYSRVFSAMRPNGRLHLGHLHGVIKSWVELQYEHDCFFMVADIHALAVGYEAMGNIPANIHNMVVDWIACGIDPAQCTIFVQSQVPAHAELQLLLSMITPLSWLERIPTYKEHMEQNGNKDLDTYGFLGYPLLQSADILLYHTKYVPVGEDQVSHVELTREIARRFNYIYGREDGFEIKAYQAMKKLGAKKSALYESLLLNYQQNGEENALEQARFLLQDALNLTYGERERLFAFLVDKSRVILTEPQAITSPSTAKLLGLDGQKMSKSANNSILLRDDPERIYKSVMEMPTDPARIRRQDKGDPDKCPVWQIHKVYSNSEVKQWVQQGCTTAGIGCVDCKKPLIDAILREQAIIIEKAAPYLEDQKLVKNILADGAETAETIANATLVEVKKIINLGSLT